MQRRWVLLSAAAIAIATAYIAGEDRERGGTWDPAAAIRYPTRAECPHGIVRATLIPPEQLAGALRGHVPAWLPDGFTLASAYGQASRIDSFEGLGVWADTDCRQVSVTLLPHGSSTERLRSGWTLVSDTNSCSTARASDRCLSYQAGVAEGQIVVHTRGLRRAAADRVVDSIPL